MEKPLTGWTIDPTTCKSDGLCAAVCPNRILQKDPAGKIIFRADRVDLCFRCGQCMAICTTRAIQVPGLNYERDFFSLPAAPAPEAYFNLLASRRAIRVFKDQPVPRELLEKIIQAIQLAPPSFPPHKVALVVVQDPALIRQALPAMVDLYDRLVHAMHNPVARLVVRRSAGTEKYRLLVRHVVPLMERRLPDLKAGVEDTITRHAPAMILFHADRSSENYHTDIAIGMAFGMLAAHALGLGACAIDLVPPAVERSGTLRTLFGVPETDEVAGCLILGFPKYHYQRGIRRSLARVTWR
jgi:nitroreductase/NAD-dependent dihydropyrimidine dehydrogenase PreA subunit